MKIQTIGIHSSLHPPRNEMLFETNRDLKIAVVDDQKKLSSVYSRGIEELGYRHVSIFNDGTSLLNTMTTQLLSFDVIIFDYQIPEMSGIEAAKIIREYKRDAKIIIATANGFVKLAAIAAGLSVLSKPFSARQLARCFEEENIKLMLA
jgi:CheY-like chemotaxis protein